MGQKKLFVTIHKSKSIFLTYIQKTTYICIVVLSQ